MATSASSGSSDSASPEMESILSDIWGEDSSKQVTMKSIWSVSENDQVAKVRTGNGMKVKNGSSGVAFPGPAMFQEAAKGGRLYMDEVYNQLEELETERRSNEGELGLPLSPFTDFKRGQFNGNGIADMLMDARRQFARLKEFISILERMRMEAEPAATSLASLDRMALIQELLMDNKAGADALRQTFSTIIQNLYESWDLKVSAVHRVLYPEDTTIDSDTVKLDVMPYLLKELAEVVRVSRLALFTVRKRYDDVYKRVFRKKRFEQLGFQSSNTSTETGVFQLPF